MHIKNPFNLIIGLSLYAHLFNYLVMKKIIWGISLVILFCIAFSFLFIRNKIELTGSKKLNIPATASERGLMNFNKWSNWWMNTDGSSDFKFLNPQKSISENGFPVIQFELIYNGNGNKIPCLLEIKPVTNDSSALYFYTAIIDSSFSPIKRFQHFFDALTLKKTLDKQLESAAAFCTNTSNIYDFKIVQAKVKDSTLVSSKMVTKDTPSIAVVYNMIDALENYIKLHNGEIRNAPMLNITRLDTAHVHTMVAFPLLKDIPSTPDFTVKKMILGNILETVAIGDNKTIANGLESLKNYAKDYNKLSPAIPFQSLLSNRLQQKDSSKWETRLSFPIY